MNPPGENSNSSAQVKLNPIFVDQLGEQIDELDSLAHKVGVEFNRTLRAIRELREQFEATKSLVMMGGEDE